MLAGMTSLALLCLLAADPEVAAVGFLQHPTALHPLTVNFDGPATSETAEDNPFSNHRVDVTFRSVDDGKTTVVPAFFAADGDAANTSADAGSAWQVHFTPETPGKYVYTVRHQVGPDVAVDAKNATGNGSLDETTGTFNVTAAGKLDGASYYGRGFLRYVGKRYFRLGNGAAWLKGGIDSPENLLGYVDFDATYKHGLKWEQLEAGVDAQRKNDNPNKGVKLHEYAPHAGDWNDGDPTWGEGRGKNLIGALNYAAGKGLNSVYFLTMNVTGDGKDVWPWISPKPADRDRFDVSKLAQWDIVFTHMQRKGLALHVVLQETENDSLMDDGEAGRIRTLYLRELCARFAHHPAIVWNLGEENTQTPEQLMAMSAVLDRCDGYDHPRVMHTYPDQKDKRYTPLLGTEALEGASLQVGNKKDVHKQTLEWIRKSDESGHPWVCNNDEIGPAGEGVKPDADDPDHDGVRRFALWGNLLAGGGGVEWYFGYKFAHHDLTSEDWRARENMWTQTAVALKFMRSIPFEQMDNANDLTPNKSDYVFADRGNAYVVYCPPEVWTNGGQTLNTLDAKNFATDHGYRDRWFDTKNGGDLQDGSIKTVTSGEAVDLGQPPSTQTDWVAYVTIDRG